MRDAVHHVRTRFIRCHKDIILGQVGLEVNASAVNSVGASRSEQREARAT
jgi:hypothetical protein